MTAELTAEQIVTNLLISHDVLKRGCENFYVTNSESLGDFLKNIEPDNFSNIIEITEKNRFSFIKEGGWNIN